MKLEPTRLGGKRPEGNGEVHGFVGFVAYGDNPWIGIRYPTGFVLLFGHVVDYVLLRIIVVSSRWIDRTYDVYLIELERRIVLVHVNDVVRIVYAEYRVCSVPIHADSFRTVAHGREQNGLKTD